MGSDVGEPQPALPSSSLILSIYDGQVLRQAAADETLHTGGFLGIVSQGSEKLGAVQLQQRTLGGLGGGTGGRQPELG